MKNENWKQSERDLARRLLEDAEELRAEALRDLNLKAYQVDRIVSKYLRSVAKILLNKYLQQRSLNGATTFSLERVTADTGRASISGKYEYIWPLLSKRYPLLVVLEKGNNIHGKLTTAVVNPLHKKRLTTHLSDVSTSAWKEVIDKQIAVKERLNEHHLSDSQVTIVRTPICVDAVRKQKVLNDKRKTIVADILNHYESKKDLYQNGSKQEVSDYFSTKALIWSKSEIAKLEYLVSLALAHNEKSPVRDGFYLLPQVFETSAKSPRLYGKGPNLQSCNKKIRFSAMRVGHQYDLKVAAYSLLLEFLSEYCDEGESLDATSAYVCDKDYFREELTRAVFGESAAIHKGSNQLATIKAALTALGFGARKLTCMNRVDDSAFRKIFGSAARAHAEEFRLWPKQANQYQNFINNGFVEILLYERKTLANAAKTFFEASGRTIELYPGFVFSGGERLNSGKLLAYIHQCLERRVLDTAMSFVEAQGGTILLPLHDGFVTDRKLELSSLNSVVNREFGEHVKFEHDIISSIDELPLRLQERPKEHIAFIKEEEKDARRQQVSSQWTSVELSEAEKAIHERQIWDKFESQLDGRGRAYIKMP